MKRVLVLYFTVQLTSACGTGEGEETSMADTHATAPHDAADLTTATAVNCTLFWTTYGEEQFAEKLQAFANRDADAILSFERTTDGVEGEIRAPLEAFAVTEEVATGVMNPFGFPEYYTTFRVELKGAFIEETVSLFFTKDGNQNLCEGGVTWLHFVAHEPGSPVSFNMLVSAAEEPAYTGDCWVTNE